MYVYVCMYIHICIYVYITALAHPAYALLFDPQVKERGEKMYLFICFT